MKAHCITYIYHIFVDLLVLSRKQCYVLALNGKQWPNRVQKLSGYTCFGSKRGRRVRRTKHDVFFLYMEAFCRRRVVEFGYGRLVQCGSLVGRTGVFFSDWGEGRGMQPMIRLPVCVVGLVVTLHCFRASLIALLIEFRDIKCVRCVILFCFWRVCVRTHHTYAPSHKRR